MRILSTADWHIRGKDLPAIRSQLYALEDVVTENALDLIIIAGDIFDRPNIADSHASAGELIQLAREVVVSLSNWAPVCIIKGNHDQSGAGSEDALHVFDRDRGVTVIRKPWAWHVSTSKGEALWCVAVPWVWPTELTRSCEDTIRFLTEDIGDAKFFLAGHMQVAGAVLQGTQTQEAKSGAWQVSRSFLDRLGAERIILGDFHKRQELVMGRGGYVGAIRQCTFGEEGNPAGVEIWNTETGRVDWIELEAAPKHRTVLVSAGTEMVTPGENEKLRVRFLQSATPASVDIQAMERAGVTVEQEIGRDERLQRAEVPEGITHKPEEMIRLWAGAQTPAVEPERVTAMIEVFNNIGTGVKI